MPNVHAHVHASIIQREDVHTSAAHPLVRPAIKIFAAFSLRKGTIKVISTVTLIRTSMCSRRHAHKRPQYLRWTSTPQTRSCLSYTFASFSVSSSLLILQSQVAQVPPPQLNAVLCLSCFRVPINNTTGTFAS